MLILTVVFVVLMVLCAAAIGLDAATGHPWVAVLNTATFVVDAVLVGDSLGRWRTST